MKSFNIFGPEFKANPHPVYADMRAECPLYGRLLADGSTTIWFVTRYADVEAILRDHQTFVKDLRSTMTEEELASYPEQPPQIRLLANHMVNMDPPNHTRLRSLVNKVFTSQRVEALRPRVQAIADELIDQVASRGRMDLIDEYALPLPIRVITQLLGIPTADSRRFHTWSHAFVTSAATTQRSQKKLARAGRMIDDFTSYMSSLFALRRAEPQDDLISSLLQAEEAGDKLTEEELFSMVILLVVSGHETVANTIGNGMLALLQYPDQRTRLQADPTLIESAVEEMMRYDGSMERATLRFAAKDITMGNQTIQRGDAVSLVLGAANRDPEIYNNPDHFDITRYQAAHCKRHMGLGWGIHYCLGAQLGRMEVAIAVNTLLQRLPTIALDIEPSNLRWRSIPVVRSMVHLPVRWS
ncbi:MAG: cytochrome P450 [Chloroflexota bacterium]